MEAQTIRHPMLIGETSVQEILAQIPGQVHRVSAYDRRLAESLSDSELQRNIEAFEILQDGRVPKESPEDYDPENDAALAVEAIISNLRSERVARAQGRTRVRAEDQHFLISSEDQAAMLKMVQERGSTSSWDGDLSAGVQIIAAANPSDGR